MTEREHLAHLVYALCFILRVDYTESDTHTGGVPEDTSNYCCRYITSQLACMFRI